MAATLQYNFDQPMVPNAMGGCTANRPDGAVIVPGPGSSKSMSLADAHSCLAVDASNSELSDRCFHVRQIFKYDSQFRGHQHLAQSERIPFRLELVSDGKNAHLVGSTCTTITGWRSIKGQTPVASGEWQSADLIFDRDILVLLLNGRPTGCYGFNEGSIDIDASQKEVFLGGMIPATRFRGRLADFELSNEISTDLQLLLATLRDTAQYHITKKLEQCRTTYDLDLGSPIDSMTFYPRISSWYQECALGAVMYHPSLGAYAIHGPIHERYTKLGRLCGDRLGHLLSDSIEVGQGSKVKFQGGNIYWCREAGAFEIFKPIVDDYEADGGAETWGFPTEEEIPANGGSFQIMQMGTFYLKTGSTHAYGVTRDIIHAFVATGGLSKWGYPTSNETFHCLKVGGHKREIHVSEFEKGTFYWSEATGAHVVQGPIREKWQQLGGHNMHYIQELGLPTSDEMEIPGTYDGRISSFEQGVIIWSPRQRFIQAIYPFKISIINLETVPPKDGKAEHDIYFTAILNENDETVFCRRYPDSESFGSSNSLEVNVELPVVLRPKPNVKITLTIDVWDLVPDGAHVNLGTWIEDFHAPNAWGMLDGRVEFESGTFKGIKNIMAMVVPQIE